MASDVELLILDEPTSGLDPLMAKVFQEVIGEATHRGTTVLLSSHILAEVETLADRLSIIRDGRIVEKTRARPSCSRPVCSDAPAVSSPQWALP